MKILKKICSYISLCLMAVMIITLYQPMEARAASASMSVSAPSSANIGDSVTVTVSVSGDEAAMYQLSISYDSGVLQYVSSKNCSGGSGALSLVADTDNGSFSESITFKTIAAGSGSVNASVTDSYATNSLANMSMNTSAGATVTVNNAAAAPSAPAGGNASNGGETSADNANKSSDNSLKSLAISPGTLSPSFKYNTTKYTATVGADVKSIAVSAEPSNEQATVESVTGNENLVDGQNTIKVVVKAGNGVTATYSIVVTKGGEGEEEPEAESESESETDTEDAPAASGIVVNDVAYTISEDFKEDQIPEDFSIATVSYQGIDYQGISFDKGNLMMLYLVPEDGEGEGTFFVYDQNRGSFYSFVKVTYGERYLIALLAPQDMVIPSNYAESQLTIDEIGTITAYQELGEDEAAVSDFYLFYAINSDGTEAWYQYDSVEGTYQRLNGTLEEEETNSDDLERLQEEYNKLSEQYSKDKSFTRKMIGALIVVCVILIIVIINLLLRGKNGRGQEEEVEDDYDEDDFEESEGELELSETEEEAFEEKPEEIEEEEIEDDFEEEDSVPSWKERRMNRRKKQDEFSDDEFMDDLEDEELERKDTKKKKKAVKNDAASEDDIEVLDLNDL